MRKFCLIASLLLASGAAQAGQMRGLTVASNAVEVEQPAQSQPSSARQQPGAKAKVTPNTGADVKPTNYRDDRDSSCSDDRDSRRDDDRFDRKPVRRHEGAEHKARRIAAKYGIYW